MSENKLFVIVIVIVKFDQHCKHCFPNTNADAE